MKTLPGIWTISKGLGRISDFGTASGSQRRDGLFSLPATARGPMKGTAASNLACPHAVKGGRVFSSIPVTMGTPFTLSSGYCIHTPLRSCDREGVVEGASAGALVVTEGWLVCASRMGEKAAIAPNAVSKPTSRSSSCFFISDAGKKGRQSIEGFSRKEVERLMD